MTTASPTTPAQLSSPWRSRSPALIVVVAGLLASGALMRIGSLRPVNLLGLETYARVATVHAALTFASLALLLVHFSPTASADSRLRRPLSAMLAVGAVIAGLAEGSRSALIGGCAVALLATVVFAVRVLLPQARSWPGALFLVAAVGQAAAWGGTMLGVSQLAGGSLFPLVLAVLVAPALAAQPRRRSLVIASVAYLLARAGVRFFGIAPLAVVEFAAGLTMGIVVLRAARSETVPWTRWVRRIEGALFLQGLLPHLILGIVAADAHLHDTLLPVAAVHFEGLLLVFALLRNLDRSGPLRSWRWAGLFTAAAGAEVFCCSMVVLGSRGMPGRYASYLAYFAAPQTAASVGALVMVLGLATVAYAALRTSSEP